MDSRQRLVILIGGIAVAGFWFIDPYLSLFALLLTGVFFMVFWIMQDFAHLPNVVCSLSEDARSVIVRNAGTAPATRIHVDLVPLDIEFDVRELGPDEEEEYKLEKMVHKVKAVIKYKTAESESFITRSYSLSALEGESYDPLKPMIPLFEWKK